MKLEVGDRDEAGGPSENRQNVAEFLCNLTKWKVPEQEVSSYLQRSVCVFVCVCISTYTYMCAYIYI